MESATRVQNPWRGCLHFTCWECLRGKICIYLSSFSLCYGEIVDQERNNEQFESRKTTRVYFTVKFPWTGLTKRKVCRSFIYKTSFLLHINLWQHVSCGFQNRMLQLCLKVNKGKWMEINHVNRAGRYYAWAFGNYIMTQVSQPCSQAVNREEQSPSRHVTQRSADGPPYSEVGSVSNLPWKKQGTENINFVG